MKLDEYDLKILETIQKDGRITKTKLAEKINLSPSPTWERLKRLEDGGVISGYYGRVNLKNIVPVTTVMVEVVLKRHQIGDFKRFEDAVTSAPEVVECLAIGGGIDYLMRIMTSDIDNYQRIMDSLLEDDIGIDKYFTYIVTKPIKNLCSIPISNLTDKTTANRP
ncbi:Lrp/AsnC family transcriptional regulator [Desulfopila sp. IMCC35008]|uniref:Lrp/AsnC family transcriptional regulator n=1 Tax=Desulfopila sp. IMCC35008 TaxID=2653858 RepID=UPI0013D249C0|nr:Lrp/AsnC family transcriptional regulator [Desulfopila sp. IMCC35008]